MNFGSGASRPPRAVNMDDLVGLPTPGAAKPKGKPFGGHKGSKGKSGKAGKKC